MTMLFGGHGSVAARTSQPPGYAIDSPWMADVNVSVRAGWAAGDPLGPEPVVGDAGAEVAAGDGVGVTLDPVAQPAKIAASATAAATERVRPVPSISGPPLRATSIGRAQDLW